MSNTHNSTTKQWAIDSTGEVTAKGIEIQHIYFIPTNAGDQIEITDDDDNPVIHLWADPAGANPKFIPFVPPLKLPGLKIATISGGAKATIQLRTDL